MADRLRHKDGPSIEEIKTRALGMVKALAEELAPDEGRIEGHRYWACNPTRSDRKSGSFVIDIAGATAGRWIEFAAGQNAREGEGGDIIDLVSYVLARGVNYKSREARGRAIDWLAKRTGLRGSGKGGSGKGGGSARPTRTAEERAADKAAAERAEAYRQQQLQRDLDKRARRAAGWWLRNGLPGAGTPAEAYLTRARGLPLSALGRFPGAIRYLPEAVDRHGEVHQHAMFCAMTATMPDGRGEIRAVHLTYLTDDARKDDELEHPRRIWGAPQGAAIRVWKGEHACSPEEAARRGLTSPLMIAEGCEKAIAGALLWPEKRSWAAGNVGNILAIARAGWPPCASEIIILRDDDPETIEDPQTGRIRQHPASRAIEQAALAFQEVSEGRRVSIVTPIGAKDIDALWRVCGEEGAGA